MRQWTREEIDVLKHHYPVKSKNEMLKLLPNKTHSAILHKASRLKLRKKHYFWTTEEKEILKANWAGCSGPQLLRMLPNKDWVSIRHKAVELQLAKKAFAKYWRTYEKIAPIKLKTIDRGYLAGLIDGEGTIRIVRALKKWYAPFIQITNTDKRVMDWLQDLLGKKSVGRLYAEKKGRKPNFKPKFVYNIASVQGVKQILEQIVDILKIKKQQALLVLEFIKMKEEKEDYGVLPREEELFEEVKRLNARGNL